MSFSIALATLNKIMLGEEGEATVEQKMEAAELVLGQMSYDEEDND